MVSADFQSGQSTGPKKDPISEVSKCAAQLASVPGVSKAAAKGAAPPVLPPWPPVAAATPAEVRMGVAVGVAANVAAADGIIHCLFVPIRTGKNGIWWHRDPPTSENPLIFAQAEKSVRNNAKGCSLEEGWWHW
eukprot:g63905.t1